VADTALALLLGELLQIGDARAGSIVLSTASHALIVESRTIQDKQNILSFII